jgi:streptogramin lyase
MSNHRIDQFTSSGEFVRKWDVADPWGVAVSRNGAVYVGTEYNIQQYTANGIHVRTWGAFGGGPGYFNDVQDVAVDDEGNVYAADFTNHRIQRFDSTGVFLNQWPLQGTGSGFPKGVTVGPDGYVYVADSGNSTIQKFTRAGGFVTAWMLPYGIPGEGNRLGRPAVTRDGLVYVPDIFGHKVAVFTIAGVFVETWGSPGSGPGQFNSPTCAVLDDAGSLYVMDFWNHRIQKFGGNVTSVQASPNARLSVLDITPNPSHGPLRVRVTTRHETKGQVAVFDVHGRLVRRLLAGTVTSGGLILQWDGRDDSGSQVGSGVYFVRYRGDRTVSQAFVILR